MPRCKPGDLAVVIKGPNCGAFVDVVCPEPCVAPLFAWECLTRSRVIADLIDPVVHAHVGEAVLPPGSRCCFFDEDLQPIRPAPEKATLPDREEALA